MDLINEANRWVDSPEEILELSQGAIRKVVSKHVDDGQDEKDVTELVNLFNTLQAKNKMKGVDIFKLSYDDLKNLVAQKNIETSKSEVKKKIRDDETDFIYKDDDVIVVSPKTHASSCKYGANTQWCTTTRGDDTHFKKYIEDGDKLYYILPKDGSDKTAIKVGMNGELVAYNSKDDEISPTDVISKYSLPDEIFVPISTQERERLFSATGDEIKQIIDKFMEQSDFVLSDSVISRLATKLMSDTHKLDIGTSKGIKTYKKNLMLVAGELLFSLRLALHYLNELHGVSISGGNLLTVYEIADKLNVFSGFDGDFEGDEIQDIISKYKDYEWDKEPSQNENVLIAKMKDMLH